MSFVQIPPWAGEDGHEEWLKGGAEFQVVRPKKSGKKKKAAAAPGQGHAEQSLFLKKRDKVAKKRKRAIAAPVKEVKAEQQQEQQQKKKKKKKARKKAPAQQQQQQQQQQQGRNESRASKEEPLDELAGAKFRMLNEQLYTCDSAEAQRLFAEHKELFPIYHAGFSAQVSRWPSHPLDNLIAWCTAHPKLVVADLGCGEARLAISVPNLVHSFDLVALNERVTPCDIANVPLRDGAVDVAIFCLSLMGTNWQTFVREAHRILKTGGVLKVAEVASRIEGNARAWANGLCALGFEKPQVEKGSNSHFTIFSFIKSASKRPSRKAAPVSLGVCRYKRR